MSRVPIRHNGVRSSNLLSRSWMVCTFQSNMMNSFKWRSICCRLRYERQSRKRRMPSCAVCKPITVSPSAAVSQCAAELPFLQLVTLVVFIQCIVSCGAVRTRHQHSSFPWTSATHWPTTRTINQRVARGVDDANVV